MVAAYLWYMQFYIHNVICLPCIANYVINMLVFLVLTMRWTQAASGNHETGTADKSRSSDGKGKGGNSQKSSSKAASDQPRKEGQSSDEGNSSGDLKEPKKDVPTVKRKGGRSRKN